MPTNCQCISQGQGLVFEAKAWSFEAKAWSFEAKAMARGPKTKVKAIKCGLKAQAWPWGLYQCPCGEGTPHPSPQLSPNSGCTSGHGHANSITNSSWVDTKRRISRFNKQSVHRVTTLQTMWISLTIHDTPAHVKCYSYHVSTSVIVHGCVGTVHDPKPKWKV